MLALSQSELSKERRVAALLGGLLLQTVAAASGPSGYSGLDRFGRMTDLHYQLQQDGTTVHRYEYGYDAAGNRTHTQVTQAPWQGQTHVNDRSWKYDYDGLQRLVGADLGRLAPDQQSVLTGPSDPPSRLTDWSLDNLGNWSGSADQHSVVTTYDSDGDGDADTTYLHHDVDSANELLDIVYNATGTSSSHVATANDPAGNLTREGLSAFGLVYQYDGLNRLVQVNEAGSAQFNAQGQITGGALGTLYYRLFYDGQGRVIQKELRESETNAELRLEKYYYDGIRRIQDVISRPIAVPPPPPCEEEPLTKNGGQTQWRDQEGVPRGQELPPCKKANPEETVTAPDYETWTDREYVYGPGDVNEFIGQIDANGRPFYMLQDGNLNVMGLVGLDPLDGLPPSSGGIGGLTGEGYDGGPVMVRQDVYSPYGEILTTDLFDQTAPDNKVGFQGPFADRLTTSAQDSQLVPGGRVFYRTGNRSYLPHLGRWAQRDPNATGQAIIGASVYHGENSRAYDRGVGIDALFADGMNLFAFVHGDPANSRDPLGLNADGDDEDALLVTRDWDDIHESIVGNGRAYLGVQGAATFGSAWGGNVAVMPRGAMAAAGVSEGFSDFADDYAEQMIMLPVEGALAGMGQFATVASVSTTGTRFARVANSASRAQRWLSKGKREVRVYVAYKNGKAVYVGISKHVGTRALQHGRRFDRLVPITEKLTRHEARAIEQLIIENNPHLQNILNSISPWRSFFDDVLRWADDYARQHGIKVFYP